MDIERENKVVCRNDYALVVIKNGTIITVKVIRPGDTRRKYELGRTRDLEFQDLRSLEEFIDRVKSVYAAVCAELALTPVV